MSTGPELERPTPRFLQDDQDCGADAPCGHLCAVADGAIVKVNATLLEWTGYSRRQLVGRKRFQDLLPVAGRIFYDTHFHPREGENLAPGRLSGGMAQPAPDLNCARTPPIG